MKTCQKLIGRSLNFAVFSSHIPSSYLMTFENLTWSSFLRSR